MRFAVRTISVILLGVQCAAAQVSVQPRILSVSSSHVLSVPPFTFWSDPGCDREGNMYFHVGGSAGVEILRVSSDGSTGKTFTIPSRVPDSDKAVFADFSVAPTGAVYVMAGIRGKEEIFRFDEDGKMDDPISPALPDGVIGTNIAVADERNILLFGYYDNSSPAEVKGKSYMAVLKPSGEVAQELHITLQGLDMEQLAAGEALSPGFALGEDGNFYLAGPSEVLVISQAGELVRRLPFENPLPKSTPTRVHVGGGLVVVVLTSVDNHQVKADYLVLLASTGDVVGLYEPAPELGQMGDMCFSPKEGMTFLGVEKKQLRLSTAHFP